MNKNILEKNYNIYFHYDFDGIASAAVIFDFLKQKNSNVENFIAVNYNLKYKWPNFKFKKNPIIVDFYFHPKAKFWFDHHETTFKKESWKDNFKQNKYHHFAPRYKSCCSLIVNRLQKLWGYKPSKHIINLSKWLDIIDGANYKSAKQAIFLKEPAAQINAFIDNQPKIKSITWLIYDLIQKPLTKIAQKKRVKNFIKKEVKRRQKIINFYNKNLKIYNYKLGIIDIGRHNYNLRYAPFYLKPNLIYALTIRHKKGLYFISLGVNPWQKNKNKIHVGKFLRKNFGGGGHKKVGGVEFRNKKELNLAIKKIIKEFSS